MRDCRIWAVVLLPALMACLAPTVLEASAPAASGPAADEQSVLSSVQALLREVAEQDTRIRTIHVRYRHEHWCEDQAGAKVPAKNSREDIYQCQWARDADGSLAGEVIQTQTTIEGQYEDSYRVKKGGMYRIHLDRSFSEGRGDGQIMPATEYTGHIEWPAMYILPFSWVDTHWLWMKVLREQQSVPDLQVQDEQRDGHRLRRIVWSWAEFDHACLVIDLDRGPMPVETERYDKEGLSERWRATELIEQEGIWLPRVVERKYRRRPPVANSRHDERATFGCERATILPVRVNEELPERLFQITWKEGTRVYDRTARINMEVIQIGQPREEFPDIQDPPAELSRMCPLPRPVRGQPYSFKLKDVYGKLVSSAALQGKVVLVSFWATWARACEEEMQQLITWYEQYHGQGLEIVGISLDEDIEDVRWCIEENSLGWPQVLLKNYTSWSVLAEVTGVESLPRMFVLDRQGHLREFKKPVDDALILDLLEEPVHNGGAGP